MSSNSIGRCAACKYLRRKCPNDCVLAPYFPSTDPQRFSEVHKIYGASNITKMLQQLPVNLRWEAAESMAIESNLRVQYPVHGCVGIIHQLQQQIIEVQYEILKTKCQIAVDNAQQWQQQQQMFHAGEPSCLHSSQQTLASNPTFSDFGL